MTVRGMRTSGRPALVRIRLLTSVVGDGPVVGEVGEVLEVDERTAKVWADGERAERVGNEGSEE